MSDERWRTDSQYRESTIASVRVSDTGAVDFTDADGWSFGFKEGPVPIVGAAVRFYGEGIGRPVRGLVIDGALIYYRSAAEEEQRHQQWCAEQAKEKAEALDRERPERDAKWAALPVEFQQRRERFEQANPKWRSDYEPYELFCCEQAMAIVNGLGLKPDTGDTLQSGDARSILREWSKLPFEEQRARVPALSDDHSGNTFGMSVRLANWYTTKRENVALEHGALTALVGCADYGCTHGASNG